MLAIAAMNRFYGIGGAWVGAIAMVGTWVFAIAGI
jgi:hypothetical protein